MNIRAKFGLASTLIAVLVICLAAFGVHALSAANGLIIRIYEQPLMGVSYGRAATATFAEARAAAMQGRLQGPSASMAVAAALDRMEKDIAGDLRIVRERIQDPDVAGALGRAEAAITQWFRSERT